MKRNFDFLLSRLIDANKKVTQKELIKKLNDVNGNLIIMATGGSYPVGYYATRIMEQYNNCFTRNNYPRDVLIANKAPNYIMGFSYSGKTPSILKAFSHLKKVKKILFTINPEYVNDMFDTKDIIIDYKGNMKKEKSFISLASTLIPMSLLLKYSMKCDKKFNEKSFQELLKSIINDSQDYILKMNDDFSDDFKTIEIFSGDTTYTAGALLKSGLIESGMAYPVLYDKNDYAHGCHSLNYHNNTDLAIYLMDKESKQDKVLLDQILNHYQKVIVIKTFDSKVKESLREFELAVKALFLLRGLAIRKNINLSSIKYSKDMVDKLYHFKGEMV